MAVLEIKPQANYRLRDDDIDISTKKGSGPGGQHVNKTESVVVMRHLPTGIEAHASDKSQHDNRRNARAVLEARVAAYYSEKQASSVNQQRSQQIGSGMRGDKIRTYRERDDQVTDHRSEKKCRLGPVLNGDFSKLFTS